MGLQEICEQVWGKTKEVYKNELPEGILLLSKRVEPLHHCLDVFVEGSADERLYRDVAAEHGLDFDLYEDENENKILIENKRRPYGLRLPSFLYRSPFDVYTKEPVLSIDRAEGVLINLLAFSPQHKECSHHVVTIYDREAGSKVLQSYLAKKGFSKS